MNHALKAYFSKGQTSLAIIVALMAQIIFIVCWMTSYKGVYDRMDQLTVAVVNEDGEFGTELIEQLKGTLPFHIITEPTKAEAMEQLELRKAHLVIAIPSGFGADLAAPDAEAAITYTVNQSNPQITKSVMDSVVMKITEQLKDNTATRGVQAVLEQMSMSSEQARQTAQALLNKVDARTDTLHPVNGLHNQMVPMMLVLGSYVGAMLMAMNVHQVSLAIGASLSKWGHFAARSFIIVVGAVLISIIGSMLIYALDGQMENGFLSFWLFHCLALMTFMFFAQLFLLALGMAGMFANMVMLSLQLVTSGTIVPREMLSGFYQSLGQLLPATYAVDGVYNISFGGIHTGRDAAVLLLILVCSAILGMVLIQVKKQAATAGTKSSQPHEAAAS